MRFLHSSDWQIGMKAAHVGSAGARVREIRIESAERVIDIARREDVEFLVLAGDTFENNGVDRSMVQKIGDIVAGLGRPVYVLPGNHDPIEIGSVWEHPVWASHGQVHVLLEARPIEVPSGFLYPCPVFGLCSSGDVTAWIPTEDNHTIRIGLAHGTVEGNPVIEESLRVPREAASRAGLDYLALGHWHSTATYADSTGGLRMAYAGTHEPTSFGERDSGNVLLVEIAERGAKPQVRILPTATLRWETMDVKLVGPGQLTQVRRVIESMPVRQPTLMEIRLRGLLFAEESAEIMRLEQILSSRFLHGRVDSANVMPAPTDENWVSDLPHGFVREAGAKLRSIANSDMDARRRTVAARALRELYALKQEVPA
jgi:DNA repair exonuclease SbcCD nuclease subunit